MNDFSHAYCHNCDQIQPVDVEELTGVSKDGKFLGGDILCKSCFGIITTVYKPNTRPLAG
jgi:hypothetical protein